MSLVVPGGWPDMESFFNKIMAFVDSTELIDQVKDVDYVGLFTNPWFLVPFIVLVGYLLFKQKWRDIIFLVIFFGIWWASGTEYMQTLVVGDELQVSKVLPVLFGGAAVLGIVIYLLFGRSD
jgi:ascorbate-specific PTS system EIIC-type component UlaA